MESHYPLFTDKFLVTSFRFFGNAQHLLSIAVLRALHRMHWPVHSLSLNPF